MIWFENPEDFERPFTLRGSVRPQTLGKPVSDDPRHFISTPIFFFWQKFSTEVFVKKQTRQKIDKVTVLEELWIFECNKQMRLEK